MLSDLVPKIPFAVICGLCGTEAIWNVSDREGFSALFSKCLGAIVCMEKTRSPAMFGPECFTTREVLLFDGFVYYGEVEYAKVRILRDDGAGTWRNLFRGIAATLYCTIYWNKDDVPWRDAMFLTDTPLI